MALSHVRDDLAELVRPGGGHRRHHPGKAMAPSLAEAWTVSADRQEAEGRVPVHHRADLDALYAQQARETDRKKREALLHQIQQTLQDRGRLAMIDDDVWPSGVGPRMAEPALLLIDPYPWAAPYEELRLKK